jgi:hypothetical protein
MVPAKEPKDLGLEVIVTHPDSLDFGGNLEIEFDPDEIDVDGHYIIYEMMPMDGQVLFSRRVRRGMAPSAAAALLRKLADHVERHGGKLLSMPRGGEGCFNAFGDAVDDPLQFERDDDGEPILPDID